MGSVPLEQSGAWSRLKSYTARAHSRSGGRTYGDKAESDRMETLFETHLSGIRRYKFPGIQLPDDLDLKALIKIFDKLNRLGEELQTFDLMVARLLLAKPEKFMLRHRWDEANKVYPERFQAYRISGMDILRLIALEEHLRQSAAHERGPKTATITVGGVREEDVLDVEPDIIAREWDATVDAFAAAIGFVQSECGVVHRSLLPSATMLLPLAVGLELASSKDSRPGFRRLEDVVLVLCVSPDLCTGREYAGGH